MYTTLHPTLYSKTWVYRGIHFSYFCYKTYMSLFMRKGTSWHEITFSVNSCYRNCFIHRPCADSNVPFIPQDQYALMQKLITMTKVTKLYMFLIATKDHFRFHGNQWHHFNSDRLYDKLSYLCFYSTYICKIGIKLKFIEQPLLLNQKMQMSSFAYS